jgi:HlyD family secretion protein
MLVLWVGGVAIVWYWNNARFQRASFRTVAVWRGDLIATINATGTLEPEEVVDVGAQIAGVIRSFGNDPRDQGKSISYVSQVDQGTVLARLDDALFKARVDQARANLGKAEGDMLQAQAKLRQAERDHDRARKLQARNNLSAQEYETALATWEVAKAALVLAQSSVDLARANLEEATVNLGYTTIRSPVKGVILDRRVNIGQTVVASFNVPSLFLIAKDLSRMEIWASVNETDIGAIHVGQGVRFTVSPFPRETFRGQVAQIRLNASMTQSVVTYTVVVAVDNARGKLLPYLTARVQFEVEERKGVLLVPNAALRWQPQMHYVAEEARTAFATWLREKALAPRGAKARSETDLRVQGTLWVRQGDFVRPVRVSLGLTDGVITEIASSALDVGSEVVLGQVQQDEETSTPFLPQIKNDKAKK